MSGDKYRCSADQRQANFSNVLNFCGSGIRTRDESRMTGVMRQSPKMDFVAL
jgi:hypothetical protein